MHFDGNLSSSGTREMVISLSCFDKEAPKRFVAASTDNMIEAIKRSMVDRSLRDKSIKP